MRPDENPYTYTAREPFEPIEVRPLLPAWVRKPTLVEWLLIAVIFTLLLLLLESPTYYAGRGQPTGVHYGPITRWITGWP